MPNLYTITTRNESSQEGLSVGEKNSVFYHDLFDYPLNFAEMIKWVAGSKLQVSKEMPIVGINGFWFLEGREGLIYKRILRKRISNKKMEIARSAARILSFVPGVEMVGVTGSLAMQNSSDESDIDLMIITRPGSLWTTRLISYFVLRIMNYAVRSAGDRNQKDKLCLNMWLDETDLAWPKGDRNAYTAHEIVQIVPLVNKSKTYEKFLFKNKWILGFWPNAVRVRSTKYAVRSTNFLSTLYSVLTSWLEFVAYKIQYNHMRSKITREVVTPTRALFHPQDWGEIILTRLQALI